MTDKQTIDVTRCIHFDKSDMPNGCTCYWDGECNHDCYYKQLKRKEQECEELKREKRIFYNFLTNKYNYGSFKPMWGAYLLRRFFNEDLSDFFNEEAYKMVDTIEEKEKQLDQLKAENEELHRKIIKIFTCLIKANKANKILDTLWVDDITTLWDYIALTLGIEGDQIQVEEQILQKFSEVIK